MAQGDARQRKGGNRKKKSKQQNGHNDASSSETKSNGFLSSESEETLWQTFTSHPLVKVAPIVLIPYVMYVSYFFLVLKRPDLVSELSLGLVKLRPAVDLHDPRQVLIVGTVDSGTQHVAAALQQVMGLEITHEASEATSYFARDGTVSSFLGIRYAEKNSLSVQRTAKLVSDICIDRGGGVNVLMPKFYQPTECSAYEAWSGCHSKECLNLVQEEWGCGLAEDEGCRSHFTHVLHLVQHPLRSIQGLMSKVCPNDEKTVHAGFRQLATIFYEADEDETSSSPCLKGIAGYVLNFNRAMLSARKKGRIDAMLQYEYSSLCDIANAAGLLDPLTTLYPPNYSKVSHMCESENIGEGDATKPVLALGKHSEEMRELPFYTWENIREAGGSALEKALRKLCKELGYDADVSEEEFGSPASSGAESRGIGSGEM